ncbi:MAG: hypothetical protein ABIH72_04520 [archaeon]
MKKEEIIALTVVVILLIGFVLGFKKITGLVIGEEVRGIPEEEQKCMQSCVAIGCNSGDVDCMTKNGDKCMAQCNAGPPESESEDEGIGCMKDCIDKLCTQGPSYAECNNNNLKKCEEECDMKGDAPDESEMGAEQLCLTNCVAEIDPSIICGNSVEGETGNEVCQRCAQECVHLYEGPCLNDEQAKEKQKACETCTHCYGEPVMGDSGEGWECIVDVSCEDASSEWGDDPGSGPGIGQEGYVAPDENSEGIVGSIMGGINDFFSGLFGGE